MNTYQLKPRLPSWEVWLTKDGYVRYTFDDDVPYPNWFHRQMYKLFFGWKVNKL